MPEAQALHFIRLGASNDAGSPSAGQKARKDAFDKHKAKVREDQAELFEYKKEVMADLKKKRRMKINGTESNSSTGDNIGNGISHLDESTEDQGQRTEETTPTERQDDIHPTEESSSSIR